MKIEVTYDNEVDGEAQNLNPHQIELLGVMPDEVLDGHIATYTFPEGINESDVTEGLDKSDWCFTSISSVEDLPALE